MSRQHAQMGYTLVELMLSLALASLLLIGLYAFISGVWQDARGLSTRQSQINQVTQVLMNLHSDVARAGFAPHARGLALPQQPVGAAVRTCTGSNCVGDELWSAYWTQDNPAYDCLGNKVISARTEGWVRVENVYRFRRSSSAAPLVLGCDGNGGANGGTWQGLLNAEDGDIADFAWRVQPATQGQLISLCLNLKIAHNDAIHLEPVAQACRAGGILPTGMAYRTIQADFAVQAPTRAHAP